MASSDKLRGTSGHSNGEQSEVERYQRPQTVRSRELPATTIITGGKQRYRRRYVPARTSMRIKTDDPPASRQKPANFAPWLGSRHTIPPSHTPIGTPNIVNHTLTRFRRLSSFFLYSCKQPHVLRPSTSPKAAKPFQRPATSPRRHVANPSNPTAGHFRTSSHR